MSNTNTFGCDGQVGVGQQNTIVNWDDADTAEKLERMRGIVKEQERTIARLAVIISELRATAGCHRHDANTGEVLVTASQARGMASDRTNTLGSGRVTDPWF